MTMAVLMGGESPERAVSLESGKQVFASLQRLSASGQLARSVVAVDTAEGDWFLQLQGVEQVFNVLHGGEGEDGSIRAVLDEMKIRCTGSGAAASLLAMNKMNSKRLWQWHGLPVPNGVCVLSSGQAAAVVAELGLPLFVKPVSGGSSTHSSLVQEESELAAAIDSALVEGRAALVEEAIGGREYTVSIVADEALPIIGIGVAGAFYDYHAKYVSEETQFECPAELPKNQAAAMTALALQAFRALGCSHWGRVDLIENDAGEVKLLEVNTVPGMTSHSLVPAAAAAVGLSFDDLIYRIASSLTEAV